VTRSVEIPDAAVEAAAGGVWTEVFNGESPWSEADQSEREDCLRVTRAALVAARPYLMATREEIEKVVRDHKVGWHLPGTPAQVTGYQAVIVDAVLALLSTSGDGE